MRIAWIVAVLACLAEPSLAQSPVPVADPALVARGSYLVNAVAACVNCHSPKDEQGRPTPANTLSGGGVWFSAPAFTVYPPNITPDVQTGIGSWSEDDIRRALLEGVRPAHDALPNVPLAPVMYKSYFRALMPRDLDAIVAYLRTVPAVRHAVPAPQYRAFAPAAPSPDGDRVYTQADMKDPVQRGHYLSTVAHCMACHSGRAGPVSDHANALGKGGWVLDSNLIHGYPPEWKSSNVPNITSDPVAGIGRWTDEQIRLALTEGISKDGRALKPPMAYSAYAQWTQGDLADLIAYLRTLRPLR